MIKVVSIVGTRPQFVKAAMVSRALRARNGIREVLVHTGQHYDQAMSHIFFAELGIPAPDYDLGIGSAPHGAQTGRMLEAIESVLLQERPMWAVVYGDTNTTLAGALAAAKLQIRVAHVEAGLRSFNRRMPEEINRVVTDHVAECLLAPTALAVANLRQEGILPERIHLVGDVMYDAALYYGARAERESRILETLGLTAQQYLLVTIHRAENTDDPLRLSTIVEGLILAASEIPVVFPLHPRTRRALCAYNLIERASTHLRLIDPVGYLDMTMLEKKARVIVTDSGGVQKEAFFHQVPCVTLREETEWVELVESGWNRLIPPLDPAQICAGVLQKFCPCAIASSVYGDGRAAERIALIIDKYSHF
jgi:UDP-GlcNAc3NAcA epimerase